MLLFNRQKILIITLPRRIVSEHDSITHLMHSSINGTQPTGSGLDAGVEIPCFTWSLILSRL